MVWFMIGIDGINQKFRSSRVNFSGSSLVFGFIYVFYIKLKG